MEASRFSNKQKTERPPPIASLVAIAGATATCLASYHIYATVKSSVTATGATAVSYISTWNCKKAHEILSQLTFHRLRDVGSSNHGHTNNAEDLVVGTYNLSQNKISDFHTLRGSKAQVIDLIKSLTKKVESNKSNLLLHNSSDHDSQIENISKKPNNAHEHTSVQSKMHTYPLQGNPNNLYLKSKSSALASKSCEQLDHGVDASGVDVYDIPAKNAMLFAQDFSEQDKWSLFMYGPWSKGGDTKYAFAAAKITPNYVNIGDTNRSLSNILPKKSGTLQVSSKTIDNSELETLGQLVKRFPEIQSSSDLSSLRLLSFRNSTISLLSSADSDGVQRYALGSAGIVFMTGIAMTLVMFFLSKKIETNQKKMHETLEHQSKIDPLTGMYNRRAWDSSLENAEELRRKMGCTFAIIAIDLNDFKKVNDTQGHFVGDNLLKGVSEIISSLTRDADISARVGGDEFAILSQISDIHHVEDLISRLRRTFNANQVEAAFGYCITSNKLNIYNAWSKADEQMYLDKATRKSLDKRFLSDSEDLD